MSASSPWLAASSSSTSAVDASNDIDPWSSSTTNIIDSDFLHPSTPSQQQQQQLRSRRSSPSFPSASSKAQVVDRHPLRSPSPGVAGPSNSNRPQAAPRRPSAVASEWKAIGAGLAGLFGGSSSNASSSSYRWPADPASSSTSKRAARQSAPHAGNLIQTGDDDYTDHYDDDEARKGRPVNTVENTLDRLEDWFGLKQQEQQQQQQQRNSTSAPSHRAGAATNNTHSTDEQQVRVLIHPVAPTDTLPSLALHYGADIQVLRKSNKLWPGDPVQIRKVIYIPVDSCKHRPPNAEIKVVPTRAGAVSSSVDTANANTLVFVPKQEDEDLLTGTPTAEIPQPNMVADNLASMRVSDPASDFMPDTNKAYLDSAAPAFGTSLTRAGSLNGKPQAYPASLTPALRNLNQQQQKHHTNKPASSIGGSNTPSITASASGASSGFVPPRQPLHVAKVPAEQLRFFASDKGKPSSADVGESGIDDLLALGAQQQQQQPDGARPHLSRQTSMSNVSAYRDDEDEDEWKPNTWHFGSSTNKNSSSTSTSNIRPNGASEPSDYNHYAGWNDAPPPHAIVAKAYDGGKAYQKRQSQKSHRLLYDLAAGLPANPGAASKWARPIQFGDSLPSGEGVSGSRSGSGPIGGAGKGKGGLGKLLDDTIRGRISVEAALEGALEGVRGKSNLALPQSNSMPPPPRRSPTASRQSSYATATPPPPPPQAAPVSTIDPLSTPSNTARPILTSYPSSSGLEQRRKVDWTKGKDD